MKINSKMLPEASKTESGIIQKEDYETIQFAKNMVQLSAISAKNSTQIVIETTLVPVLMDTLIFKVGENFNLDNEGYITVAHDCVASAYGTMLMHNLTGAGEVTPTDDIYRFLIRVIRNKKDTFYQDIRSVIRFSSNTGANCGVVLLELKANDKVYMKATCAPNVRNGSFQLSLVEHFRVS